MTSEELQKILRKCWSRETSGDPQGWMDKNPAWMQCAVTALVAQDILGGKIVKGQAIFNKIHVFDPHYWNQLPDGREIDFTKEQFPKGTVILKSKIVKNMQKTRLRLTSDLKRRYAILKSAVEKQISENQPC